LRLSLPGPEIKGGPRRRFAMPFWPNFLSKKNVKKAETALQNAFKVNLLDFGPGKLNCKLLMCEYA
jgi:hypothetical protein